MDTKESVERFGDGEEASCSAQMPSSEPQNTVLYTVLNTEEVDSSIREFSYIWSSGGFDIGKPDTGRLGGGGDGSCHIAIFKIDTEKPESTQNKHQDEHTVAAEPQSDHELLTLPATCYSAEKENQSMDLSKGHRRDSSSVYTPMPRFPVPESSFDTQSIQRETNQLSNSAIRLPFYDGGSAKYSDCLQDGEAYCTNRYVRPGTASTNRVKRPRYQQDVHYWQDTTRGVQSSDIPRFQVELPLPRSRSVGRRFISRLKFWKPVNQDNASSKPQSYMSHSKRSITASIASSWSRKAKGYLKHMSTRDMYPPKKAKSSHHSIRTVSPKSIFSRPQKSPVSNYSDFLTELNSNNRVGTSARCPGTPLSSCSKDLPILDVDIQMPMGEPRPFQCTFCLMQWENNGEWTFHEAAFHMRPYGNLYPREDAAGNVEDTDGEVMFSMSDVLSIHTDNEHPISTDKVEEAANECLSFGYHLYTDNPQTEEEPKKAESWNWLEKRSSWFWNCGFCELILRTWTERQEHLAEHFEQGITMLSWNPLASPYPFSKFTLTPVEGFPPWDFSPLHSLQQPGFQDDVYRASNCPSDRECNTCKKHFPDVQSSMQHANLWHNTPESWICPGPEHATNPAVFFDTETVTADASDLASLNLDEHPDLQADQTSINTKTIYKYDYCLCCGEVFHESPPDWDARKQHLRDMHHISETDDIRYDHRHNHGQRFYREELFSLHLANCHNVRLDYLTEFTEFCRKKAQAPVLMVQSRHLEG
ncbi:predicted protein [Uncinocarpus reesii 1704]|uniref:C2H2-type domain-containing protein n=1 Tax=Uncinocarpus reesii (strain UAMH 1704) TaxID=336963 RepID=C4JQA7_UNCRE|nr:uncharacterized protein UREG_04661 [Uncinocarpus reesii 1704]EEP79815.1 predicted protein [Uncinocarpus reesii 1704]